jgi:hypothetical protein
MDRLVELAVAALHWTLTERSRPGRRDSRGAPATATVSRCGEHGYELRPGGICWRCEEG